MGSCQFLSFWWFCILIWIVSSLKKIICWIRTARLVSIHPSALQPPKLGTCCLLSSSPGLFDFILFRQRDLCWGFWWACGGGCFRCSLWIFYLYLEVLRWKFPPPWWYTDLFQFINYREMKVSCNSQFVDTTDPCSHAVMCTYPNAFEEFPCVSLVWIFWGYVYVS